MALLPLSSTILTIHTNLLLSHIVLSISHSPISDVSPVAKFAFSWLDNKDTFKAGDVATIKVKVLENADKVDKNAFKPILSVNGKTGNSCYVSSVLYSFQGDTIDWKILFTPIMAGLFNVIINEKVYQVFDSSMHFQVDPGKMYPSVCVASWKGLQSEYEAGLNATVMILPRDAFGNNITNTSQVPTSEDFALSLLHQNGSFASLPNITNMGWNEFGYIIIDLFLTKAGNFSLRIEGGNQTLNGSPLPLKVNPGPIDVPSCVAEWSFEPNAWQLYSKMQIVLNQLDEFGNLVPGFYTFDAEVVERDTKLPIPISDLDFKEVGMGTQLASFSNSEPGNFFLTIYDIKHNKSISNMPYAYTVFVGYCDGVKSVVNGSGLSDSVAGLMSEFFVYLNDIYQYPSPVEAERLQVQITRANDSYNVWPTISPMQNFSGSRKAWGLRHSDANLIQFAPAPYLWPINDSTRTSEVASAFHVIYTPDKSGKYEIRVYCGNILLNGAHPFMKEVRAGEVNVWVSGGGLKFAPKVAKLNKNEIVVQLMDSFLNPVLRQESKLKLEIGSVNSSGFSVWNFADNNDGSYSGYYLVKDIGTYEMCISFDGKHLSPCPFGVNVYSGEYFPKAYNDTIYVWEDESIAFDALENDYFAGANASIVEFSKPDHGSLLQNGRIFRYTPYKDFYGNDSFWYTFRDINENLATGSVSIFVLSIPPQFVSFPTVLKAMEDVMSPRFGGFPGFEIRYSDLMENIYVNLSAQSGSIFLSPMLMQFWQPIWTGLSVDMGGEAAKHLILEGSVEVINLALQSIQYLGNENFCGADTIRVSAKNRNGLNDLDVPVSVEPINDRPFINAPDFIILTSKEDKSLIFDKEKDKFGFFIGDPDLLSFPGGESEFVVTFSVEVNDGFLITNLPAHLINTTELKTKITYQWQPLQTYVTISKHFMVKASGIRFRGTVSDCNSVMQQLLYQGGRHGAVLTVTLNDMGNYGCYPDCAEGLSSPLYTEGTVNLIRRRPMSSLIAHALGSAIIIELIIIFTLGVILLFFTCKCAILLVNERRKHGFKTPESLSAQVSHSQTSCTHMFQDATCFTGCCSSSSPFFQRFKPSNFRQRSRRVSENGECSKAPYQLCSPSSDTHQLTLAPTFAPLAIEKETIQ